MLLPIVIAVLSVMGGAVLGLAGRRGSASALATVALVTALAVVLGQLLPDALAGAGLAALGVFAAGAALPTILEKLAARSRQGAAHRVGLELGYAGLLVHKVGDGIGLGMYGGAHHAGHGHFDVLIAIAAHTVPMVALVTIAFHRASGARAAILRASGLALAASVGVVLPGLVPTEVFVSVEPWVTAGVGGLLLHVVAHDWQPSRAAGRPAGRIVDLLAILGAVALVVYGSHDHHAGADIRGRLGDALLDLTLETAPALLAGLVIGAALSTFGGRLSTRWLQHGGALRQALRGAVVGAPLPICACGVLPLASSLRRRGAGAALVVAFLLATPELGVETLALTARFVGWPFAIVRLFAAVALAVVAALVVSRVAHAGGHAIEGELLPREPASQIPLGRRLLASFDELLFHVAPWTAVGLVAAAYVEAAVPVDAFGGLRAYGLDVLVVTVVAVPSYVCAASATPLAAVLLLKGMSPGAVLVGLLLGPATNLATVGFLRKSYGGRATVIGLAAVVASAWAMAALLNVVPVPLTIDAVAIAEHEHGWLAAGAAVILGLAVLRSIGRAGLRTWLASLGEGLGGHDHDHDHGGHGHDHDDHHGAPHDPCCGPTDPADPADPAEPGDAGPGDGHDPHHDPAVV